MMWRGVRNWPFWPARGDLAEHVFVEVALGVAILHRDVGEQVDDLGQQRRRRDGEARALHVRGMRRALLGHRAQERKDVLGDDLEHASPGRCSSAATSACPRRRRRRPVPMPSLPFGKDAPLHRLAEAVRLVLLARMGLVEPAHEQQVGDLLDHLERIGDAARPEGVPDLVDLRAEFTCQHALSVWCALRLYLA